MARRGPLYPRMIREKWPAQGLTGDVLLGAWVKAAYEYLATRPRAPTFGGVGFQDFLYALDPSKAPPGPLRQVGSDDDDWRHLRSINALLGWIYLK